MKNPEFDRKSLDSGFCFLDRFPKEPLCKLAKQKKEEPKEKGFGKNCLGRSTRVPALTIKKNGDLFF